MNINKAKIAASIDRFMEAEGNPEFMVNIGPSAELEQVVRHSRAHGSVFFGGSGVESLYAIARMGALAAKLEINAIIEKAVRYEEWAPILNQNMQWPENMPEGIGRKLVLGLTKRIYELNINWFYRSLQDDDSRFHSLKNGLSITCLDRIREAGCPIDLFVSDQLDRIPRAYMHSNS